MAQAVGVTDAVPRALVEALGALEDAGVALAVLRPPGCDGHGVLEADVLVDDTHRDRAEAVLVALGFRRRPGRGRQPHRFYVRPVAAGGDGAVGWLKLDVVDDLCFGPRHQWPTRLGRACLRDRRPGASDGAPPRLAPADALLAHLLHALLDRGVVRPRDEEVLVRLAAEVDRPGVLARHLTPPAGPTSFAVLVADVAAGRWEAVRAAAPELQRRLVALHPVRAAGRSGRSLVLRRGARPLRPFSPRGALVACLGTDGSGKSTLVAGLVDTVGVPCRSAYGGTYRSGTGSPVPGLATTRVLVRLLGVRVATAWHRRMGRLVVLDRHPLEARPRPGDDLALPTRVRRRLLAATVPTPDLVLALDAPPSVLAARRPEHSVDRLERDRDRILSLRAGARREVLDATAPPEAVRGAAIALIWRDAVATGVRGASRAGGRP